MNKPETKKHYEIREYVHNGVKVVVEIDYDEGYISLLDSKKTAMKMYAPKQWIFARRAPQYMEGWKNIFHVMEYAVTQASIELKKHQDAEEKIKIRGQVRILKAIF